MKSKQQGSVLILTLIALAVMLLGAVALFKSTEGATLTAGNVAFRDGAVSVGELGLNDAATYLSTVTNIETSDAPTYYATILAADSLGVPTIDWAVVPVRVVGNYNVQFVIDRLCSGPLPVADLQTQCSYDTGATASSNRIGSTAFAANAALFYRATTRITGPKNTEVLLQARISR